jgi:prepilin-type N-terminal cleavage/methylation domain-containing protein
MMQNLHNAQQRSRSLRARRGFTLVEVLAAITVMGIVLPALMYGISLSANLAAATKQRTVATTLADEKLNELLSTGDWQTPDGGSFGDDGPGFSWTSTTEPWNDPDLTVQNLQEVDVTVTWHARLQEKLVVVSSLVYVPVTDTSGLTTGTGAF